MKLEKLLVIFVFTVGISILAMWVMFLATNSVPELETEPGAILMHLIAEILTATMLIVTGISFVKKNNIRLPLFYFSMGMLLYTVINSSGYFIETGDMSLVIMFGVIAIFTLFFTIRMIKTKLL